MKQKDTSDETAPEQESCHTVVPLEPLMEEVIKRLVPLDETQPTSDLLGGREKYRKTACG